MEYHTYLGKTQKDLETTSEFSGLKMEQSGVAIFG